MKSFIKNIFITTMILSPLIARGVYEVGLPGDDPNVGIGEYINDVYNTALGISGIAAVAMIVVGAIYYTASGGSPDKQKQGKSFITSALWGLVLLVGAFLILNTINPRLTQLEPPTGGEGEESLTEGGELGTATTTDSEDRELAEARSCMSAWSACKNIYGDDFKATYTQGMKFQVFDCESEEGCGDGIKTTESEVQASEEAPLNITAQVRFIQTEVEGGVKTEAKCAVSSWNRRGLATEGRTDALATPDDGEGQTVGLGGCRAPNWYEENVLSE